MSIEIPKALRTPVRFMYMLLGGTALVGLGFPWCFISWWLLPRPIISGFIWGFGIPGNCAGMLYFLHGSGVLVGGLAPWEVGMLGWCFGMGFLLVGAWLEQATRSEGVDGRLCAMLLKPFGVELRVKSVGLGTFIWVIPLVATLFSLAAYFVASWISYPQSVLECDDIQLPSQSAEDLCLKSRGSMKSILDHRNHCCYVKDNTFDLTEFFSSVGGNVVAGYGIIKIFGSVGVAVATDVELDLEPSKVPDDESPAYAADLVDVSPDAATACACPA